MITPRCNLDWSMSLLWEATILAINLEEEDSNWHVTATASQIKSGAQPSESTVQEEKHGPGETSGKCSGPIVRLLRMDGQDHLEVASRSFSLKDIALAGKHRVTALL